MSIKVSINKNEQEILITSQLKQIMEEIENHDNNVNAHRSIISAKMSTLLNDSSFVSDANYVHTDNNFTNDFKAVLVSQSGTNTGDETQSSIINKLGCNPVVMTIALGG